MAKSDKEKLDERLEEIQDLLKKKADIENRLMVLTSVRQEEKKPAVPKPEGFSLMDAITTVITEKGAPMNTGQITEAIKLKYDYSPETKNVRATAKYMVKREQLVMDGNKAFSLKQ